MSLPFVNHDFTEAVYGCLIAAIDSGHRKMMKLSVILGACTAIVAIGGALLWTGIDDRPTGAVSNGNLGTLTRDAETAPIIQVEIDQRVAGQLATVMDATRSGSRSAFDAALKPLSGHTVATATARWQAAVFAPDLLSPAELSAASQDFAAWPLANRIRANAERAALSSPMGLVGRLVGVLPDKPETQLGRLALAQSLAMRGETEKARNIVVPMWRRDVLTPASEADILARFGDILTPEDHQARYMMLMARERISAGKRIASLAQRDALHDAWSAVIRDTSNAKQAVAALEDALLETQHGVHMRMELARKNGQPDEAAALLLANADTLPVGPDADPWWSEVRIVARMLVEQGDPLLAYRLVTGLDYDDPVTAVDAAFHAGWIALRKLRQPERAALHFNDILAVSDGPSSRSRGLYWLGRAHAASGNMVAAEAAYREAVAYPTSYHGQLASVEIGLPTVLETPQTNTVSMASVATRHLPVAAGQLLYAAGEDERADALFAGLADTLDDPSAIAAVVDWLGMQGRHYTALRLAKAAQWRGVLTGLASHPVGALPLDSRTMSTTELALSYAIARQESEFRIDAVSRVGALGLLQVMPATAKAVAARLNMPYEQNRMTTDAAYNTAIGTRYLADQRERFGGSYILTFVAYNAGPGRAREWIERFGDPRELSLHDAIDWVVQIPFPETRGYVQKVMENLQVYKARLGAEPDIARDMTTGKQ